MLRSLGRVPKRDFDRQFDFKEDLGVVLDVDRVNEVFCVAWVGLVEEGSQPSRSITSVSVSNVAARERGRVDAAADDADGDGDDGDDAAFDDEDGVEVVRLAFLVRGGKARVADVDDIFVH